MIPVVSIVGYSNSGKTTLIERIIPMLKNKGYKIGIIKHDAHDFNIDYEGKDSWRMRTAGADTVVISSKTQMAIIKTIEEEAKIDDIVNRFFTDVHLVITEGYKAGNKPKIEVVRLKEPSISPSNNLIGIVDNTQENRELALSQEYDGIHKFKMEEVEKIAEFIEERFLRDVQL